MESNVVGGIDDDHFPSIGKIVIGNRIEYLNTKLQSKGYSVHVTPLSPPCFKLGEGSVNTKLNTGMLTAVRK